MTNDATRTYISRRKGLKTVAAIGGAAIAGCLGNSGNGGSGGNSTMGFTHLGSFGKATEALFPEFQKQYPEITAKHQQTPAQSTSTHKYYVNQFISQSNSFDAGQMDVIWPAEFASNGWIASVDDPKHRTKKMLDTPVEAATYDGKLVGMPLYTDCNALYYRRDVLDKYEFDPPKTYMELVHQVQEIQKKEDKNWDGYIWQGGPNEGLTIMWLNWLWGWGGTVEHGEKLKVNTEKGVKSLQHARDLIYKYSVSPRSVVSGRTDQNRQTYQNGNTLFMRNWPYALSLLNQKGVSTEGKVGVAPLPNRKNHMNAQNSCLGGWSIFINAFAGQKDAANKFATFIASEKAQAMLATEFNYLPVRKDIYEKEKYVKEFGQLKIFKDILKNTNKRPATPKYTTFSEIMYTNLNACLSKQKSATKALDDAQKKIDAKINTS